MVPFTLRMAFLLLLGLFFCGFLLDSNTPTGIANAERLISSSAGLDVSKVYFKLDTEYDFHGELYEYAASKLAHAGLFFIRNKPYEQGAPVLKLTIYRKRIAATPKVLYKTSLDLYENAVTERVPPVKVWTVTWTYGTEPRVEDESALIE